MSLALFDAFDIEIISFPLVAGSLFTFGFPLQVAYDVIKFLLPSFSQASLRPFISGVISPSAVSS
jgi:hypothetical protein